MYRKEIDGLRAIAIISIIINYFDKTLLPNGHLGVDIFYVISGFVITQSIAARYYNSLKDFLNDFYARRIKRLLPALVFCVVITFLFSMLVIRPQSDLYKSSLRTGIAALFGVSNIFLLKESTDYFGSAAELNPFTHTWSLGVEIQFYLIFPLLIWLSGLTKNSTTGIRNFTLIVSIIGIISALLYFIANSVNPVAAFYLLPTRFWELSIGAITYLVLDRSKRVFIRNNYFTRIIPILATVFLFSVLLTSQLNQGIVTLLVVTLTAVFIAFLNPGSFIYKILISKVFVFLGLISYSLYLWHWSVLTISRWTIGVQGWSIFFQISIIFLLSTASYFFIEKPLRRTEWSLSIIGIRRRSSEFVYAALTVFVSAGIMLSLEYFCADRLYTGQPAPLSKKGVASLLENYNYDGIPSWIAGECILMFNDDVGKVIVSDNCTIGNFETAKRRFLVIGNSYSVAEFEMYRILADKGFGSITVTSSFGASPVPNIKNNGPWDKANEYYWGSVVPSLIKKLRRGDIILMINDDHEFCPKILLPENKEKLTKLHQGLSHMSDELYTKGITIIYQTGIPFIRESNCTPDTAMPQWWHINQEPPCNYYTKEETSERRRAYNEILSDVQNNHPNFLVLDLFEVFCPEETCRFYNEKGIFLYRDEWSHPSVEACILSQPLLKKVVNKAIKKIAKWNTGSS